jgi:hypothetical protein
MNHTTEACSGIPTFGTVYDDKEPSWRTSRERLDVSLAKAEVSDWFKLLHKDLTNTKVTEKWYSVAHRLLCHIHTVTLWPPRCTSTLTPTLWTILCQFRPLATLCHVPATLSPRCGPTAATLENVVPRYASVPSRSSLVVPRWRHAAISVQPRGVTFR